jgi:hypothetical protein
VRVKRLTVPLELAGVTDDRHGAASRRPAEQPGERERETPLRLETRSARPGELVAATGRVALAKEQPATLASAKCVMQESLSCRRASQCADVNRAAWRSQGAGADGLECGDLERANELMGHGESGSQPYWRSARQLVARDTASAISAASPES